MRVGIGKSSLPKLKVPSATLRASACLHQKIKIPQKHFIISSQCDPEHAFFSSITEQVSDAIIATNKKFRIIFVNKAAERLYGYSKKELIGKRPDFLNAEPMADQIEKDIHRSVVLGKTWVGRHLNRRKDGTTFICEFKITPIKDEKGKTHCYCGIQRDVSDKEEMRKIILAERDLGVYLSAAHDLKEALGHILDVGLQIEGVDSGGIYLVDEKQSCLDLVVSKGLEGSFVKKVSHFGPDTRQFQIIMQKKPVFASYPRMVPDGSEVQKAERLRSLASVPVVHQGKVIAVLNLGSHYLSSIPSKSRVLITTIAERIGAVILRLQVEAEFKRNAFHDSLTNIPNRRFFIKNLMQSMKRARRNSKYRFAILFLDLDRFKDINDGLGHLIGDKVILETSQKLQSCLRANDTIARFGGDEFTILLDGINGTEDAIDAANRIHDILSHPILVEDREFYMTGSIGVLMHNNKYHSPEDMLRDADTAMYKAKLSGKARYAIFDETMHTTAVKRVHLENDLRKAISLNQIKSYYQPIVSLRSGLITGVEVLVRWHHPERGVIMPNDFISLAEETGVIVSMTEKILEEASQQVRRWTDQGHPLRLAVNLSMTNLAQQNLPSLVEDVLLRSKLKPGAIEFEITENAAMKEAEMVLSTLQRLKAVGSHISIDDFGVGYAPLVYLKQYPISKVKIDMSFIHDIPRSVNAMAIIQAIIAMAHILNIHVVAEGVETVAQVDFLKKQNCDEIQGFLFSQAVLPLKIDEYLKDRKNISHLIAMS